MKHVLRLLALGGIGLMLAACPATIPVLAVMVSAVADQVPVMYDSAIKAKKIREMLEGKDVLKVK